MGKIYQNKNQIIMREMIKIYQPDGFDWLSYQITRQNILTPHHVVKVADGGLTSIDNLALVTKKAHRALNMCESRDFVLYSEINDFFRIIIAYGAPLDESLKRESKVYKEALVRTLYK